MTLITLTVWILFSLNLGLDGLFSPNFMERPFIAHQFSYEAPVYWSRKGCEEAKKRAGIETFCIAAYLISTPVDGEEEE